ncbi:hypothetical protein Q5752_003131 [Cryptotrichosporon argae]
MPTLADTLSDLSHHSQQVSYLSSLNARPAGPFASAYLYLDHRAEVLSLIREADAAEVRLFKFVGESHPTGPGGGNKRVEKLDGVALSELREYKQRAKEGDEIAVTLGTAQRLVDDYRPMPRARAHITNLQDAHQRQKARIAELERLIVEASRGSTPAPQPEAPTPEAVSTPPRLSADEALRAEEEYIRALEAEILPHRRAAAAETEASDAGAPRTPAARSAFAATTPRAAPTSAQSAPVSAPTPAPPQTPRAMPNITNSLVHGATPHKSAAHVSRFSPLRLLGTPRAPVAGPSRLRAVQTLDGEEPRPIFGKPRATATPRRVQAEVQRELGAQQDTGADDTIRLPAAAPVQQVEQTAARSPISDAPAATPTPAAPADAGRPRIDGVQVDAPSIQAAIDKLWETTGDLLRAGLLDGQEVPTTPESTIQNLHRVAQSDPTAPPSPSSASAQSAVPEKRVLPITREHIVLAHLYLLMLRAAGPAPAQVPTVDKGEAEQELSAMCKARGWADAGVLVLRAPMRATGTKTLVIDRKGSAKGMWKFHA